MLNINTLQMKTLYVFNFWNPSYNPAFHKRALYM